MFYLVTLKSEKHDRVFEFADGVTELAIGRQPSCGIQLPIDKVNVSRKHCVIRVKGDYLELEDTSSFGTFVNNQKVGKCNKRKLTVDDVIASADVDPDFKYKLKQERNRRRSSGRVKASAIDSSADMFDSQMETQQSSSSSFLSAKSLKQSVHTPSVAVENAQAAERRQQPIETFSMNISAAAPSAASMTTGQQQPQQQQPQVTSITTNQQQQQQPQQTRAAAGAPAPPPQPIPSFGPSLRSRRRKQPAQEARDIFATPAIPPEQPASKRPRSQLSSETARTSTQRTLNEMFSSTPTAQMPDDDEDETMSNQLSDLDSMPMPPITAYDIPLDTTAWIDVPRCTQQSAIETGVAPVLPITDSQTDSLDTMQLPNIDEIPIEQLQGMRNLFIFEPLVCKQNTISSEQPASTGPNFKRFTKAKQGYHHYDGIPKIIDKLIDAKELHRDGNLRQSRL